jgi:hypothetical protein
MGGTIRFPKELVSLALRYETNGLGPANSTKLNAVLFAALWAITTYPQYGTQLNSV